MKCLILCGSVFYSTETYDLFPCEGTELCTFLGGELGFAVWEEAPEFGRPLKIAEETSWSPELWVAFMVWRIKFKLTECGEIRALGLLEPVFTGGA